MQTNIFEDYTGLKAENCVILDTETTGVAAGDRIVELSIIDLNGNTLYNQMFDPDMPMPDPASRVNGITDDMLWDKPSFHSQIPEITSILQGKTLIGWNVAFDERMLAFEYSYVRKDKPWNDMWDVMSAFAKAHGMKNKFGRYTCKLVKAKSMLGLGDSQEHRSLADCLDTLAVLDVFVQVETSFLF